MHLVVLQFQNVFHLLEYVKITGKQQAAADTRLLVLTCEATEAEIELAVHGFQAALLSDPVE